MRTITAALLSLVVATASGCSWRQQHLTRNYGQSYATAFAAQRVSAEKAAPAQAVTGLDSQEAAIICDTYRASLAPKGVAAPEQPLLMIAPQKAPGKLAPSVPKE